MDKKSEILLNEIFSGHHRQPGEKINFDQIISISEKLKALESEDENSEKLQSPQPKTAHAY